MLAIGEDEARAFFLIPVLRHPLGRAETVFGQRRIPPEDVVFGNEHVGMAVAGEIDKLEIGIVPFDVR